MNIGVDMVQISRIKNPDTLAKGILCLEELELYNNKGIKKVEFLAGRFAAKEAFMKSIEKGIDQTKFKDVKVLYRESGAPYIDYKGEIYEVSISHDGDYAIAIVLKK